MLQAQGRGGQICVITFLFLLHLQNCYNVKFILSKKYYLQYYLCTRSATQKISGQNQSVPPIETQLETLLFVLYYVKRTFSFYFKCVSIKIFFSEVFVV